MNKGMLAVAGVLWIAFLWSCQLFFKPAEEGKDAGVVETGTLPDADSVKKADSAKRDGVQPGDTTFVPYPGEVIHTKGVRPEDLVRFAKTLVGTPYLYGSGDPEKGLDCSGFITYVFNHFGITVPRSSIDFTHVGKEVPSAASRPGDLILFTGTDSTLKLVGHMGIIVSPPGDSVAFIHSTSGKTYGVTITPLNTYYQGRYVKTVRVFGEGK